MKETTTSIVGTPINNIKFENLPKFLMHHIMNFLPYKDAAKLSALSKTFHATWLSFPVLHFDNKFFEKDKDPSYSFMSFILKTLHLRCPHHINKSLQRLSVSYHDKVTEYFPFPVVFDALLTFATEKNSEEIMFCGTGVKISVRRDSLLPLFSSQFLNTLHLVGFRFPIADSIIQCPKLKDLVIKKCEGLQTVMVSSLSLEEVDIRFCSGLKRVELKGKNLLLCYFDIVVEIETDEFIQCDIACESIKEMHLHGVKISENLMELVTWGLFISKCEFPESLRIQNPIIKMLEVEDCYELEGLSLLAPNLEHFWFESFVGENCKLNTFECGALKLLVLKGVTITDGWARSTISKLGCLEELTISDCHTLEKMELRNDELKIFSLKRCFNLKEAVIHAPNLNKFYYKGSPQVYPMQFLSAKSCTANIELPQRNIDTLLWFGDMKLFLSCFDDIEDLTIACSQTEDLIFPRIFVENNASPLRNLKHIKVRPSNIPEGQTVRKLVESTLWLVHKPLKLEFCISGGGRASTLKFEYGEEVKRMMENERCCLGIPTKCWRHYVRKVDIRGFNESEKSYLSQLFDPYLL